MNEMKSLKVFYNFLKDNYNLLQYGAKQQIEATVEGKETSSKPSLGIYELSSMINRLYI